MKTVKQIPVKKFELINGVWSEGREMTLPEPTWERVRKMVNTHVKYELLATNTAPARQLMPKKDVVSTTVLVKTADPIVTELDSETNEGVDYSNYSLAELREACKNAEIKFGNVEKEASLIKKLKKNEGSSN